MSDEIVLIEVVKQLKRIADALEKQPKTRVIVLPVAGDISQAQAHQLAQLLHDAIHEE